VIGLLVLAFIVLPILELFVIVQVAQATNILVTVALIIAISAAGGWLMKREGRSAWQKFNAKVSRGEVPTNEIIDGFLVLFGGALLLTPGFVSDLLGLVLLLPPTRALVRPAIRSRARTSFVISGPGFRQRGGPADAGDVWDVEGWEDAPRRDHPELP
jgi:UPF0716 protein FxsA